jgi:hypothetical protein
VGFVNKVSTWIIGDPSTEGFKGVKLGKSNNDLRPGESPELCNYFADDMGLTKREGYTLDHFAELGTDAGITGLFRYYDGYNYHTFAKCGSKVFDVKPTSTESEISNTAEGGDVYNQMADWKFSGANVNNTNYGLLYWKTKKTAPSIWGNFWGMWEHEEPIRVGDYITINVYKDIEGDDYDSVCSGNGISNDLIILSSENYSGLSGLVAMIYSADDVDLENNTLNFKMIKSNNLYITPLISNGDTNKQLDDWQLNNITDDVVFDGTMWWTLTDSEGVRTVNIYQDSSGSVLLATGTISGEGSISLSEVNNSDINGNVTLTTNIYTLLSKLRTQYIAHCGTGNDTYTSAKTLLNELISDYKAHCAEGEKTLTDVYNLLSELITDYPNHCARTTSHSAADTVNNSPTALASSSLEDMIVTANSLKTCFNAHDGEYGTYHTAAGTSHQVMSINAYDLYSLITLANDIRTMYEAHRIDDGCHTAIDTVNAVGIAVVSLGGVHVTIDETNDDPTEISADTLTAMITSANSFKANFNAHDLNSDTYHKATGTSHQINTNDATDMESLITLVNAARIAYEAHRQDTDIHISSDATNSISTSAVTIGKVHATTDTDNEDPTAITDTYLSSMCTYANSLKAKYNAHDADGVLHHTDGTGAIHQVSAADATTTATLITLVNAIRAAYEAHVADTEVHIEADTANVIDEDALDATAITDNDIANNTLEFKSIDEDDEIGFTSWFSRYFFSDGNGLYSGTTGSSLELKLYNESGYSATADDNNEIQGVQPHGNILLIHKERLWFTRDPSYPTRVYWSQINYYNRYFTNGGTDVVCYVNCGQNDGQNITGMVEYQDKLFVTKLNRSYWISGEPADNGSGTLNVSAGPTVGAYDQKSVVVCPDGYIRFFGPDGVWEYSDMLGTETTGARHISSNIDYELKQITSDNKVKCCAAYYDHYYLLFYPCGDVDYCNRGAAYDTKRQQWYPIHDWNIAMMCKYEDDTLRAGLSNAGYVTQIFNGYNDNGDEIAAYFKSRLEGQAGIEQCLDSIKAVNVVSGGDFTISWGSDGDHSAGGSFATEFTGLGARLDEFILDEDILVSLEEIESEKSSPTKRANNAQRFSKIYFELSESSIDKHSLDYLEIKSYPIREI